MRLECLTCSMLQYGCKITAYRAAVQVSSSAVKILTRLKCFSVRSVLIRLQVAYQLLQIVRNCKSYCNIRKRCQSLLLVCV